MFYQLLLLLLYNFLHEFKLTASLQLTDSSADNRQS